MSVVSVAVVQGGPCSEAEVSRASGRSVARALEQAGCRVVQLELDDKLSESLRTGGFDVVFPIAHGTVGEDGSLQGLLEIIGLPYVGSGVLASAVAMHKHTAKVLFSAAGLPVLPWVAAHRPGDGKDAMNDADRALRELGDRVVVKPCSNGSAIGVHVLKGASAVEIARAVQDVWAVDDVALVERFAPGREVTCGVLELAPGGALPPTEIRPKEDAFYTYEAKYAKGGSLHLCPAPLQPEVTTRVQALAVAAHRALGCRDLSRVDFVIGEGDPNGVEGVALLEVNTLPGFTDTSLFPEAAAVSGMPMTDLCRRLVDVAIRRGPPVRNVARPLP